MLEHAYVVENETQFWVHLYVFGYTYSPIASFTTKIAYILSMKNKAL